MEELLIMGKDAVFSREPNFNEVNTNCVVVGSSGSGKTVSIIEPYLLHTKESSIICSLRYQGHGICHQESSRRKVQRRNHCC